MIPSGVEVWFEDPVVIVKGPKGTLDYAVHSQVEVFQEDGVVRVIPRTNKPGADALAGTTRALLGNMVTGVSRGFEKKLELVGVGYRAQMKGRMLNLTLGYSHPIDFPVPEEVVVETPSNTQIVVQGIDKQRVGQVAATIRSFRPPEPYKGKGIRYADEVIVRKVAKKK
jgi:large subunit ribosomal protein L6